MGCPEGEVSVSVVDDAEMAGLNRQYRKKRGPTNVLSFPMNEGVGAGLNPHLLGDVVISADTAFSETESEKKTMTARLTELSIHGVLHLLGHDHGTLKEAAEMEALESAMYLAVTKKIP